jgi:hypothetical protein
LLIIAGFRRVNEVNTPRSQEVVNKKINEAFKAIDDLAAKLDGQVAVDSEASTDSKKLVEKSSTPKEKSETELAKEVIKGIEEDSLEKMLSEITKENYYLTGYIEFFDKLSFDKKLELLGVTKPILAQITDSLVLHGYYEQELKLRSTKVILRSRNTGMYLKFLDRLGLLPESSKNRLQIQETLAILNCAGSLRSYGDKEFAVIQSDNSDAIALLDQRITFIKELPSVIYTWLSQQVVIFDLLLSTATSAEGMRNF